MEESLIDGYSYIVTADGKNNVTTKQIPEPQITMSIKAPLVFQVKLIFCKLTFVQTKL